MVMNLNLHLIIFINNKTKFAAIFLRLYSMISGGSESDVMMDGLEPLRRGHVSLGDSMTIINPLCCCTHLVSSHGHVFRRTGIIIIIIFIIIIVVVIIISLCSEDEDECDVM